MPFLIIIPLSAPIPAPIIIAVGVASPRAHGQAITSVAMVADIASITIGCFRSTQGRRGSASLATAVVMKNVEGRIVIEPLERKLTLIRVGAEVVEKILREVDEEERILEREKLKRILGEKP